MLSLAVLAAAGIGIVAVGARTPSGFLPQEDQGAFFIETKLPDGASLNRTREVVGQIETVVAGLPGIRDVSVIAGYSMLNGLAQSNSAFFIVTLKPFEQRKVGVNELLAAVARGTAGVPALVVPFNLPPIIGLGTGGGFEYQLQNLEGRPRPRWRGPCARSSWRRTRTRP